MKHDHMSSEHYRRTGWWRDGLPTEDLARHAAERPDDIATLTASADGEWEERLTYRELNDAVDTIAAGLLELGVETGEAVCFQLPNWWHFTAMTLACARIGAVSCPMVPILRERDVGYILRTVRSRIYIAPSRYRGYEHEALGHALLGTIDTLEAVFGVGGPRDSGHSFEKFFLDRRGDAGVRVALDARRPDPDDLATIKFTSGTTGEPKGVMHTHNTLFATTRLVPHALGLDQHDVIMMPSPLAHASGFLYGTLMPVIWGMKVVYQDIWDPRRMLQLTEDEGGTWSIGSPPFLLDLIRACDEAGRPATPLRLFTCAGAPIPRHLARELPRATGARLASLWGMTETGAATITPRDRLDRAQDSDGLPSPVMEVRIVDEEGRELPCGTSGRLLVRGASRFVGYFERDDLTRQAMTEDGWLDTGDIASVDDTGYVTLTGRSKDILIRGGENIPLVEIESALMQHDAVREVAVVAVPDPRLGERACAVVVAEDGHEVTLQSLVSHLRRLGFPQQYWPEYVATAPSLPRTPAGKIQKFVLEQQLEDRRD